MMRTSFNALLSFPFSIKKVSQKGLQAIWAEVFFTSIAFPKVMQVDQPMMDYLKTLQITDKALKQKLYSLNDAEEIKAAKDKILQAIDIQEGVELPFRLIRTQERFTQARNQHIDNNKITFYPNHFVTHTLFKTMADAMDLETNKYSQNKDRYLRLTASTKTMTVGKQGISKSFSYLFAWYLSSITNRYRYENYQQAQQLIKEQLLDQKFTKIIYLNFNQLNLDYGLCQLLFQAQCPQIWDELKIAMKDSTKIDSSRLEQIVRKILTLYMKKNIDILMILDQINAYARICKQYNIEKIPQLQPKIICFKNILSAVNKLGPVIYNSSSNIEEQLLGGPTKKNKHTLGLNYHSPVKIVQCQYQSSKFKQKPTLKQLYRLIWYQMAKRLSKQDILKYNDKAILKCDQLAQKGQFFSTFTPYSLRQLVAISYFQFNSDEQVGNKIQQIRNEAKKNGMNLLIAKCQGYFNDLDKQSLDKKIKLTLNCLDLYYQYKKRINQRAEPSNQTKISKQKPSLQRNSSETNSIQVNKSQETVSQQSSKKTPPQKFKLSQNFFQIKFNQLSVHGVQQPNIYTYIYTYINRDIFSCDQNSKTLKLIISDQELQQLNLIKFIIRTNTYQVYGRFIKQKKLTNVIGQILQRFLIQYLQLIKTCKLINGDDKITISKSTSFVHLNKYNQKISQNFTKICQMAINNPDANIIGNPVTDNGEYSTTSMSFDFIIVKYIPQSKSFRFTSFDISLNKSKSDINKKFIRAKKLIAKIQQNLKNNCSYDLKAQKGGNLKLNIDSWVHHVVCTLDYNFDQKNIAKKIYESLKQDQKDALQKKNQELEQKKKSIQSIEESYNEKMKQIQKIRSQINNDKIKLRASYLKNIKVQSDITQDEYLESIKAHINDLTEWLNKL